MVAQALASPAKACWVICINGRESLAERIWVTGTKKTSVRACFKNLFMGILMEIRVASRTALLGVSADGLDGSTLTDNEGLW